MEKLIIILAVCLALISPTGAGTLMSGSSSILGLITYDEYNTKIEQERLEAKRIEAERIAAEEEAYRVLHTYGLFERYDLEGYGFISIPKTHFSINEANSAKIKKEFTYLYDDISYMEVKFQTNLTENDIEHLGTNVCNFKGEHTEDTIQCGDYEVIKITGEENSDDYLRISWCIVKGKSVLIINGYIAPGVDKVPFCESIEASIDKISVYYISKTVFDTPTTGYWATIVDNVETGSPDEETIERPEGTVGGEYPGTIITDKVTSDWRDLKIILDGDTLYVPCKMSDLVEYGYKLKDADVVGDLVKANYKAKLVLYKENGLAITVLAQNRTDSSLRLEALDILSITVNKEDFGYYTSNSTYTEENLPELILVSGITWDIKYADLLEMHKFDFTMDEESNGNYVSTFLENEKKMIITTDNYKDIIEASISIDLDYKSNTGE